METIYINEFVLQIHGNKDNMILKSYSVPGTDGLWYATRSVLSTLGWRKNDPEGIAILRELLKGSEGVESTCIRLKGNKANGSRIQTITAKIIRRLCDRSPNKEHVRVAKQLLDESETFSKLCREMDDRSQEK